MQSNNGSIYVLEFADKNMLFDLKTLEAKIYTKKEMFLCTQEELKKEFIEKTEYTSRFEPVETNNIVNPTIITSYKCNYSCEYCFEKEEKKKTEVMSAEDIIKIARFYDFLSEKTSIPYKIGDITIMGGEPLLVENVETLNSITKMWPGNMLRITTNGTYLTEYMDFIGENNIEIKVSLGGTEEVHHKRRKCDMEGVYDKTIQGIKELLNRNVRTTVMIVFTPEDIYNYIQLFDLLVDLGWTQNPALEVAFIPEIGVGGDDMAEGKIIDSLKAFRELKALDWRTKFVDARKLLPGSISLIMSLQYAREKKYEPYRCSCLEKPNYAFLPDGRVQLCAAMQDTMGCIGRYKPTIEIDFEKINQFSKRRVDSLEKCKDCRMKALCLGGCAATSLSKKNEIIDTYCGFWDNPDFLEYLEDIL